MGYLGLTPTTAQQNYLNIDDISGSFNGSTTSFALLTGGVAPSPFPVTNSCLISVGGVIQEPDDTGTSGFRISGSNIVFSSAPGTGEDFFGLILAGADYLNVGANFPAGTVGAPSITFDGDTNTGIYRPSADELSFVTGGSDRVRIDSNGRLGIGTSSPTQKLHLGGANPGDSIIRQDATTGGTNWEIGERSAGNYQWWEDDNDQVRMTLTSTGRLGIGTTSPSCLLNTQSTSTGELVRFASSATSGEINISLGFTTSNQVKLGYDIANGDGILQTNASGSSLLLKTVNTERARIDGSGRLIIGHTSSIGIDSKLQIASAGSSNRPALEMLHYENADGASQLTFTKSRGTTVGSSGAVTGNDDLGGIYFRGDHGAGVGYAAHIRAEADGGFSTSNYPGRLIFATTASSGASSTDHLTINNQGRLYAEHSASNFQGYYQYCSNASFASNLFLGVAFRAANSAYEFARYSSGDGADAEFRLVGDGNAYADGSWSGGGADYAEYFEWSDGNTTAEDRRGISVVLDGDKIREAVAGEEPIGVISGNPSVVGDADIDRWKGKYLRDDFGTYIQEDYEVEDEDGNTVVQQRRKLNPDYDPDQEYVSREERPEWDCVGLMGKLRIRKGQVTGARWIKMRDISDNVEEWLVR